jgi:hypothetical protein
LDSDQDEQEDFIALYGESDNVERTKTTGAETAEPSEANEYADFDSPVDTGSLYVQSDDERRDDLFSKVDSADVGGQSYRTSPMTPIEEPPDSERETDD